MYFSDVRILKGLVRRRAIDGRVRWTGSENSRFMVAQSIYPVNIYLYGTHSNERGTRLHRLPREPGKCACRLVCSDGNVWSKPRPLGEGGYRFGAAMSSRICQRCGNYFRPENQSIRGADRSGEAVFEEPFVAWPFVPQGGLEPCPDDRVSWSCHVGASLIGSYWGSYWAGHR